MHERKRFSGRVLMLAGLILAALALAVFFAGCEKETPAARQQPQQMPVREHASADQPKVEVTVAEQTTCPVMGGAINKAIFVEYQGKKVYFCCGGCPEIFKADPAKYIAKLPQFQK